MLRNLTKHHIAEPYQTSRCRVLTEHNSQNLIKSHVAEPYRTLFAEPYVTHVPCSRTLNNNNLTSLGKDLFENLYRLRTLRLSDNNLICDCHLAWLARWLRRVPRLGLYTRCFSPNQLKGQNVADLHDQEFKCSGKILTTTTVADVRRHRCRPASHYAKCSCVLTLDVMSSRRI